MLPLTGIIWKKALRGDIISYRSQIGLHGTYPGKQTDFHCWFRPSRFLQVPNVLQNFTQETAN